MQWVVCVSHLLWNLPGVHIIWWTSFGFLSSAVRRQPSPDLHSLSPGLFLPPTDWLALLLPLQAQRKERLLNTSEGLCVSIVLHYTVCAHYRIHCGHCAVYLGKYSHLILIFLCIHIAEQWPPIHPHHTQTYIRTPSQLSMCVSTAHASL